MNFDDMRKIAFSFPGVTEDARGTIRIGKRFLSSIAKIDPDTLIVKVPDPREREYFLTTKPQIYYMQEHYVSFECLLIRMPVADPVEVRQLFEQAWLTYAPKKLVKAYQARHQPKSEC